jgi:hypothetical protein
MELMSRRPVRFTLAFVFFGILAASSAVAQTPAQTPSVDDVISVPNPPNTAAQQAKHYVVLVSLDGFRYDYAVKYGATILGLTAPPSDGTLAPLLPALNKK